VLRRFAYLLIVLVVVAESDAVDFSGHWGTFLTPFTTALFAGLPGIHLPAWDLCVILTAALGVAQGGVWVRNASPLRAAMRLTLVSIAVSWLWGMLRGGSAYQSLFQLHCFVMQFVTALMIMATCRTQRHFDTLGKVFVFAALYRSGVVIVFYFSVARFIQPPLPVLTDHHDSATFAACLLVLFANAANRRTIKSLVVALFSAVPILTAAELNNRRIAWLMLALGLVPIYALLPPGRLKRGISRTLLGLAPLLVAYIVVGWGRPDGIFTPVGSISTMFGSHQDTSSLMRDIENFNLMVTLRSSPLFGVGWGHEYIEQVAAYSIADIFPQYRYMPHNSLLGVVAFTGVLFLGIWQIYPVAAFLALRTYRATPGPGARAATVSAYVVMIVCALQMWGDVGFNDVLVNTLLAMSLAVAGRFPVLAGVWPESSPLTQPNLSSTEAPHKRREKRI
jgi:hypothetical protein